jgi:hypothetical protein
MGEHDRAKAFHLESLDIRTALREKRGIAECLEGLSEVATAEKRSGQAVRLFSAADVLREAIRAPLSVTQVARRERDLRILRSELGDTEFTAMWDAGRTLSWEEVAADVMQTRAQVRE